MPQYDPMNTFGDNVKSVLHDREMTQQDLADLIGMNRGQLTAILNGTNDARSRTLKRIADALELPVWDLMNPDFATSCQKYLTSP